MEFSLPPPPATLAIKSIINSQALLPAQLSSELLISPNMTVNVFSVAIFFICLRESLETSVIVSVLLAFLHQSLSGEEDRLTRKQLNKQASSGNTHTTLQPYSPTLSLAFILNRYG